MDPGIRGARGPIGRAQQVQLAREVGGDRRLAQTIEVVRPAVRHRHHRRATGIGRDGPRLTGRLFEVRDRDVVGVGVARARAGLGANARPLAHVSRRLLDHALFQHQLLDDAVLEIDVGVVDLASKGGAEQPIDR